MSIELTLTSSFVFVFYSVLRLRGLASNVLNLELARDDLLKHLLRDSPVLEHVVRNVLGPAVSGKVVVLLVLDEKYVGVAGSRHV